MSIDIFFKKSNCNANYPYGKTIAKKALFYKGFGHFSCCEFRFALLVFEPLTRMYFIKIFRSIRSLCRKIPS